MSAPHELTTVLPSARRHYLTFPCSPWKARHVVGMVLYEEGDHQFG